MYKKQLKAQKILCLVALVVAVILFLYALGLSTDLYDTLNGALRITAVESKVEGEDYTWSVSERSVPGAMVYFNIQSFNQYLVKYAIVYILLAVLLFVTNTHSRRRYYISNYISVGLFTAASIYIPIFAAPYIRIFKQQWLNVDFEALKTFSETYHSAYTESTLWFDLSTVVFVLMVLAGLLVAACCVWKVLLMREEKRLIDEGKKVKA